MFDFEQFIVRMVLAAIFAVPCIFIFSGAAPWLLLVALFGSVVYMDSIAIEWFEEYGNYHDGRVQNRDVIRGIREMGDEGLNHQIFVFAFNGILFGLGLIFGILYPAVLFVLSWCLFGIFLSFVQYEICALYGQWKFNKDINEKVAKEKEKGI